MRKVRLGRNTSSLEVVLEGAAPRTVGSRKSKAQIFTLGFAVVAVLGAVPLFFGLLSRELVAVAAMGLMVALIMLHVPIGIALGLPGILGLVAIGGWHAGFSALAEVPFESVASWSLSVLPMFILMGMLLWKSGLTAKIYRAAGDWLNWLPGGLAVSTLGAGAGLAAVSGSTIGTTFALGRVAAPELHRAGYDKRFISGTLLLSGLPGQLIPPSIMLILYAGIAEVPVGRQLIAGTIPGIVIAVICMLQIVIMSLASPKLVGGRGHANDDTYPATSWRERWSSLGSIWPLFALILVVLGGMLSGVLTATEAGAAGALGALFVLMWNQRGSKTFSAGREAFMETITSVGSIFVLLIGAHFLTRMIQVSGVGFTITDAVTALGMGTHQFMLVMVVIYLIIGMFMDPLAMMLITVPLLMPTLSALEISPLLFGVFVVFLGEIAIITPPVGLLSYILFDVIEQADEDRTINIQLKDIFVSILWFLPAIITFLLVLIFVPDIVTLLL